MAQPHLWKSSFSQLPLAEVDQKSRSFCAHRVKIKILTWSLPLSVWRCVLTPNSEQELSFPQWLPTPKGWHPSSQPLQSCTVAFLCHPDTPGTLPTKIHPLQAVLAGFPLSLQSQPWAHYPLQGTPCADSPPKQLQCPTAWLLPQEMTVIPTWSWSH